ncbi:hypothetical protein [Saccharomonospora sp. CUA-673]|uniref:hypothetical protein n=1 Tax=Saccharomonospora sp. CUA-673 TaxID=1904969 RepID=UPI001115394C|nr:hypothetical protein [Saccharomonospora sp. CUA-673]
MSEHEGWRAALAAADVVVSDLGSLSVYAAAADTPMLLAAGGTSTVAAGSAAAELAATAPRLDPAAPLRPQVDDARAAYDPGRFRGLVDRTVDGPGSSMPRIRSLLYSVLGLSEPDDPVEADPVPCPDPEPSHPAALRVGAVVTGDGVAVSRFPSPGDSSAGSAGLDHWHRTADPERARMSEVDAATILYLPDGPDPADRAARALATWPSARLVAAVTGARSCTVYARGHAPVVLTLDEPVDPLLAASLVHVVRTTRGELRERELLFVGDRRVVVSVDTVRSAGCTTPPSGDCSS